MAGIKLILAAARGDLDKVVSAKYVAMATAATAAMKAAAQQAKTEGRSKIGAAGFGIRWQNTLRAIVYPQRGIALGPAVYVHHKIPYATIFEDGGAIAGRPLLWLPTQNCPPKIGRRRTTPQLYRKEIGPLRIVRRPGKKPILVADLKLGRKTIIGIKRNRRTNLQISTLQRQGGRIGSASGKRTAVAMFVGVPAVNIHSKFNIRKVCEGVRQRIPELFAANLRDAP